MKWSNLVKKKGYQFSEKKEGSPIPTQTDMQLQAAPWPDHFHMITIYWMTTVIKKAIYKMNKHPTKQPIPRLCVGSNQKLILKQSVRPVVN
jgi:hypothetical protein